MVPAPANVRRHFLPWDRPLLPQAVEYLAAGWRGDAPLDLSRLVVAVPTRQSGRRLREALAGLAGQRGQAVFPPRLLTPEALLAPKPQVRPATRMESLIAWIEVFGAAALGEFREVFPLDPPSRGFVWAFRLADQFCALQATLAEAGLRIPDVPGKAGDFPESERWRQLGLLEARFDASLASRGAAPAQAVKIAAAAEPAPLFAHKVVLIGVADPIPLALQAVAIHAQSTPVEILIHAPAAEEAAFDGWGRPLPAAWSGRQLDLAEFDSRVRLCADPSGEADQLAALAAEYGAPAGRLGAGVADSEVLPLLEAALARAKVPAFNPEGRPRRGDRLHRLLESLAALAQEPSFEAVEALARCPDFIDFLAAKAGGGFSPARWLTGLDELRSRHLPSSLAAALARAPGLEQFPELGPALSRIDEIRKSLCGESFAASSSSALGQIFAGRRFDLARGADVRLQESAVAWTDLVRESERAAAGLAPADAWELAIRLYAESVQTDEKPSGALEMQGWLELLFEDAPHLAVAGLNDGSVPEAVAGDPFLPEALRERLGLKTNAARMARDAYLLTAMEACRRRGGRLDLLLAKNSEAGDPLRPSRLLLKCPDEELPRRINFLFRELEAERTGPSWRRAWKLRRPDPIRIERLRVTDFRDYLRCPYRFFLKRRLRLDEFDPDKSELDALDFGTLCHGALEALANDSAMRDCTDASVLRRFLHLALDASIRGRYGAELPLPLLVQTESARQRLGHAASVLADQRAQGWAVQAAEKDFSLSIGGIRVTGKIDRIERNRDTGAVRVLDYKTSDRSLSPLGAHVAGAGSGNASAPDYAKFSAGGREWVWRDLQLPLYLAAVESEFGLGPLAGYFNLPKAAGDTEIDVWQNYDADWREAARRCSAGIVDAIASGIFWPPAELRAKDETLFAGWFHEGTAESIAVPREEPK